MAKKNIVYLLISVIVMIFLPFCAVRFVNRDAGMVACLVLFFAVNPIVTIIIGVKSGRNLHSHWFQPLLLSALFVLGAWIFFDKGETAFVLYGAVYLVIGYATALFAARKTS